MSRISISGISPSESLIMDYLWKNDEGKLFPEIMDYLTSEVGKGWAKQTVNTFLGRLTDKGLIRTELRGKRKVYCATQTMAAYEKEQTRKLLNDFYDGSIITFLSSLTGGKQIDKKVADNLRAMIEDDKKE